MTWKVRFGICCTTALLALTMGAYAVIKPAQNTEVSVPRQEAAAFTASAVVSWDTVKPGFLLRNCGGYIGVYRSEKPELLLQLTAIEVATLRQVDRDLLEQGLYCRTERELHSLLEDLGS